MEVAILFFVPNFGGAPTQHWQNTLTAHAEMYSFRLSISHPLSGRVCCIVVKGKSYNCLNRSYGFVLVMSLPFAQPNNIASKITHQHCVGQKFSRVYAQ